MRPVPVRGATRHPRPAPAPASLSSADQARHLTAGAALAPAAVLVLDAEQRICQADGAAFARHGLDTSGWIGLPLTQLLPPDAATVLLPRWDAALAGEPQSFDYRSADSERAYWVQMAPMRDGAEVTAVVAVMHDITERAAVSADLARSEARLQEAERMVGVGSWELDLDTSRITFSAGFARLMGLGPDVPLDLDSHLELVHPDDRRDVTRAGVRCIRDGASSGEYRILPPGGGARLMLIHAEMVEATEARPRHMRGAVLDVTDQRAAERERLAAEQLFRQGFDAAPIGMLLSCAQTGACLQVNDAMCRMLQRTREELLGQPIEVLAHPDHHAAVRHGMQEIVAGQATTYKAETRFVRPDGTTGWGLLHITPVRRADASVEAFHAQFVDISERREREELLESNVGHALWLGRIRDALDQRRLMLYTQPIIDLETGETVQHELLLRMRGEDGSLIGPGEFLPAAERFGLIAEIDRWVIREAVQIAASGTPTEFNLSGRSIGDPAILRELADAIEETGCDPSLLVVEVTETAILGRTDAGREFAERVRGLGCRLALDDFGTGFSSLTYLKHLPADHLKIDIEFVRELATSETDARVVRGIVALAREFNQTTIAEGVEDEETMFLLRSLGVDHAQGYLFGKPAPRAGDPAAASAEPARCSPALSAGADDEPDPVEVVRGVFSTFARRDVDALVALCHPDVVFRAFATAELVQRQEPWRGHAGVRAYVADVERVWDDLRNTRLMFRRAEGCVIAFARSIARRNGEEIQLSVMWVLRVRDGLLTSLEVFQTGEPASDQPAAGRLTRPGVN